MNRRYEMMLKWHYYKTAL